MNERTPDLTIDQLAEDDVDQTSPVRYSQSYSHDKTKILNRLRRIEGQVRGVQ